MPSLTRPAPRVPRRSPNAAPPTAIGGPNWFERFLLGTISTQHLALFCRQFAQYSLAGVPLLKTLGNLEKQFAHSALGPVIGRLRDSVREGDSLVEAMAREPQAFDSLFLGLMKVAEARGGIPETLRRLAEHYEARRSLIRVAQSAMIYPIIVLIITAGVVALLTMWVLPMMFSALEMRRDTLPLPTRLLMGFSGFMRDHGWWAIPAVVVGGFFGVRWLYRTAAGKRALDQILLHLPGIGKLLGMLDTARYARTMAVLLDGGVNINQSLELTADVMQFAPYQRAVLRIGDAVREGVELTEAMADARRFPPDVLAVVESGEESGRLPESLEKVAEDYDERISLMVKNLAVLIQPVILLVLGGIVFFVVLSFILAYVSALQSASTL
jgi:type II secretory pathway component PulF